MSGFDVAAWLGAEYGEGMGHKLQASQVEFLTKAYSDGAWDESDVPAKDGMSLTPMQLEAWIGLARDGAKDLKKEFHSNDANRIKMWLTRLSYGGDDVSSMLKDGASKQKDAPLSKQCVEDMAAQGAKKLEDIAFLELSFALARSLGQGETAGWQYKGPVQLATGATKAKKWGIKTFDDVLEEAEKANDLSRVSAHVSTAVEVLTQSEHEFAGLAASRVLSFYQKACRSFDNKPKPTIFYLREYRLLKQGRGFPDLFDAEIANRAQQLNFLDHPARSNTLDDAMVDKIGELTQALDRLRAETRSTAGQVSNFASRLATVERSGGSSARQFPVAKSDSQRESFKKQGKCFHCGEKGHMTEDCPEK